MSAASAEEAEGRAGHAERHPKGGRSMTGYDWERRTLTLERENADLRNQADRAWTIANLVANAAMRQGILIDEDGLGDHFLSLRAIDVHTAHKARDLEKFRKAVVVALVEAMDAVVQGVDAEKVFRRVHKVLLNENDRSKSATMTQAREQAAQELADARFVELELFTVAEYGADVAGE